MAGPYKHPVEEHLEKVSHYPLSAPIRHDITERLNGPFSELHYNTVYRIGRDQYAVLFSDRIKPNHLSFDVFKKTSKGFSLVTRESGNDGVAAYRVLVNTVERNGGLIAASKEEVGELARHLWDQTSLVSKPTPAQSLDTACLNKILSGEQPAIHTTVSTYLQSAAFTSVEPEFQSAQELVEKASATESRSIPVKFAKEEPVKVPVRQSGAAAEGLMMKFLREEKWLGKKGLAIGGVAVALGAVAYTARKLFHHDTEKSR